MGLSETLLTLLVGSVLVPILQWIKVKFKWSGTLMLWASVVISIAFGVIVSILMKDGGVEAIAANPSLILTGGGAVFATAQVVYKIFKDKLNLGAGS